MYFRLLALAAIGSTIAAAGSTQTPPPQFRAGVLTLHMPSALVRVYEPSKGSGRVSFASTIVNDRDTRRFSTHQDAVVEPVGQVAVSVLFCCHCPSQVSPTGFAYLLTFGARDGRWSRGRQR